MLETDPSFRPVRVREGYPPLEDLGLIGDGATVALVGLDGSIYWLCLPRFDSEPVFCGLLDRDRGVHFSITPDELTAARQRYEPDTGVLVTELRSPTGAITLKLCDHWVNGSLVAAPTSSLPAPVGGVRNWDYRYTWIRDAAFTVFALRRIGFGTEADAFLGWVLDVFEQSRQPRIMYDLEGSPVPDEREDPELEGYRRSAPVRWGNGAADQRQHDVYGEILDCADQWVRSGGPTDPSLWAALAQLADMAGEAWRQPDQGIWEVRGEGRIFTYSAAMCQVALDRAAAIGERLGLPGPVPAWRAAADKLRQTILDRSWDEDAQTLSEHLDGGGSLDASLLALPLRRVLPAGHPRMVATTAAIVGRLSAGGGLLYRYLHHDSPDGIAGDEGAFVLCSFWLVDNLAMQVRLDEAAQLYASLCARASPLGLLSEQIDPSTGEFIGNYPQAFSHIGVIASGVTLARALAAAGGQAGTAGAPA